MNNQKLLIYDSVSVEIIDDIVIYRVVKDIEFDLELALKSTEVIENITKNKPMPILVDFGVHTQSKEVRDYFAKNERHLASYTTCAILANNPVSRVLANFFIGLNRPKNLMRVFTDENTALAWLKRVSSTFDSGL